MPLTVARALMPADQRDNIPLLVATTGLVLIGAVGFGIAAVAATGQKGSIPAVFTGLSAFFGLRWGIIAGLGVAACSVVLLNFFFFGQPGAFDWPTPGEGLIGGVLLGSGYAFGRLRRSCNCFPVGHQRAGPDEYVGDIAAGRNRADMVIDDAARNRAPDKIVEDLRALVARGVWTGVEIGFANQLARQACGLAHCDSDDAEVERWLAQREGVVGTWLVSDDKVAPDEDPN